MKYEELVKCINSDFCESKSCPHIRWHTIKWYPGGEGYIPCIRSNVYGTRRQHHEKCGSDCRCSPKETYFSDTEEYKTQAYLVSKSW